MISPRQFVDTWGQSTLRETQGYQSHFNELCQMLGHKTPTQLDPTGEFFTFEENVEKATGGRGRADVWYKGHFAWEYKGKHKDLDAAYAQVLAYRGGLGNPPLLVVCDFNEYRIYPQWPNTSGQPFVFYNHDLLDRKAQNYIRWLLEDPEKFLEERQEELERREKITLNLAEKFARLADLMRHADSGWTPMQIARFLTKLVFALFAEDVDLLPRVDEKGVIRFIADGAAESPESFTRYLTDLFRAMNGEVSDFLFKRVPYFNGGLFADSTPGAGDGLEVLDITAIPGALDILRQVSEADWKAVNPTIFGTLFEGALDDSKRAQLGAHYTGEADIRLVIDPVLMTPLNRLWDETRSQAEPLLQTYIQSTAPRDRQDAYNQLSGLRDRMIAALANTRVLDPACGSGNFLYVSLRALKNLEGVVRKFFEPLELPFTDVVTPRQLYGIEKDEFAARLAHVVVWIGYLQWRYEDEGVLHFHNPRKGSHPRELPNPIIQDKTRPDEPEHIVNDDAIMRYDADGQPYEPEWPEVDVIIGNPPFLGDKYMRLGRPELHQSGLGDKYVDDLRHLFGDRIPGQSDLVCYWFEKARALTEQGKTTNRYKRVGLLATNSIRGGANRKVLERIKDSGDIFTAWEDKDWVVGGAAVRISIVGFDDGTENERTLNGSIAPFINSDLSTASDLTSASNLSENLNIGFIGTQKTGPFDISDSKAKELLDAKNSADVSNSAVIYRFYGAEDITNRWGQRWIIDFGVEMPIEEAQKYEAPFNYLRQTVLPVREKNRQQVLRTYWWIHEKPRPAMRQGLKGLERYIATPRHAKYRTFVWFPKEILPDSAVVVFARDDDYFFGVLHSYLHEVWSLRMGTWLGKGNDPRYTPTTTFETFPFSWPPGKEDAASPAYQAISAAAKTLHEERHLWLNPPDLISLGAGEDSPALRERTLTNLYNAVVAHRKGESNGERIPKSARDFAPRMAELHAALDRAVLAAYGWDDLADRLRTPDGDEELLRRLLNLNLERAG